MSLNTARMSSEEKMGVVKNGESILNGSVSGGGSRKSWANQMNEVALRERRKLMKGFTNFLESSGRMESDMYEAIKAACQGNERQSEVLMEPVKMYCQELRSRFEELGGERWPLEVIGVMRENGVETVEELRELCELGAEVVQGGSGEHAKRSCDELALLHDAWNQERETLFKELNKLKEQKRLAEETVLKCKNELKEECEANGELREMLRKQESEPKEVRPAREIKETPVPAVRLRGQENSEGPCSPVGSNNGDRKTVRERRGSGAKMKCFTCGGIGHGSWQCVSKKVDKVQIPGEKLGKVPKEVADAQYKTAAVCGERGRGYGEKGRKVVEPASLEVENERKKVKIRASAAVIGPRLKAWGPGLFEYRDKTMTGWAQKFDWGEVNEAVVLIEYTDKEEENSKRVEFVESIARKVNKVWMVPGGLQCVFRDVAKVAKQWREWLKTSTNVEVVDPLMPVGEHKIPLILQKWNRSSLEDLREYLLKALPIHSIGCQLKKDGNPDRRRQFGFKTDVDPGTGHPIAERRGKWLRRVSPVTECNGKDKSREEKARGNQKT